MATKPGTGYGGDRPKEVTGRTVLLCLVAFFAIVAGVNGVMMAAAITTFGGVETASAYQAGLAFARETSAVQAQDRMHWRVDVRTLPGEGATTVIEIVTRDRTNAPLSGLQAAGLLSHPTDRRADRTLALREAAPGVFRAEIIRARGQWDLVVELSRDGQRQFRSRNRVTLN